MRRVNWLGITGAAMLLGGAATFMSNDTYLPLWITWIVGPLLWYLGFAISLVWGYHHFFDQPEPEPIAAPAQQQTVIVVRRQVPTPGFGTGPAGVLHEIPAMGAFIL